MPLGFIGLGVMGEPMCRNLAQKGDDRVLAFDTQREPLDRLSVHGIVAADGLPSIAVEAEVVFLSLPSARHVEAVCYGPDGLLAHARPGQTVVDLGTTSVELTRRLANDFAGKGARYADAPIARTRQAAETGTLSIMVGTDPATFETLRPLLSRMATDVTHCGTVGTGQIAKIMNNMVLVQTVVALGEALAAGRRAGIDRHVLFDVLSKGSADSFALRNHGMKALLPDTFPERAFSTEYALKDLSYALELAGDVGLDLQGARLASALLGKTVEAGYGDLYWPVVGRVIDRPAG